jgi:hypothetical protein
MRQVTARRRSEIDDVASFWTGDGLESRQDVRTHAFSSRLCVMSDVQGALVAGS